MGWFSRKKAKRFVKKYGKKALRKTPYGRAYTAGEWSYKAGRSGYNRLKSRQRKSRRGSSSSSPENRNRRGPQYYYHRGKRIYYQYQKANTAVKKWGSYTNRNWYGKKREHSGPSISNYAGLAAAYAAIRAYERSRK